MAAKGHLESYLNRDVSVITTREIRYQGELASFDKENRTITLRRVHNMGTEDRISTMRMFPSAKVFDFIVFHAEHLKDFRVAPRDSEDPAIVSCVSERPSRSSQGVMNMLERPSATPPVSRQGRARNIDIQQMLKGYGPRQQQSSNRRRPTHEYYDRNKPHRRVSFKEAGLENVLGSRERSSSYTHIPHIPRSMVLRFTNIKKSDSQPNSRKKSTPGQFVASKTAKMKFDDDFDFQKALEDFQTLNMSDKKAENDGEEANAEDHYNRDKSFFDKLSTTTIEAPKRTRKDEFEANKVTFGVSHIRREKWRRSSLRHSHGRRRGGHDRLTA